MNDDAKRLILARRARFVAAAVAGISIGGCDTCSPRESQGERTPPSDTTTTRPTVCLSPMKRRDSSTADDELANELERLIEAGALGYDPGLSAHDAAASVDGGARGSVTAQVASADSLPNVEVVVRSMLVPRARACYDKGLQGDPTMAGTVALRVTVTAKGDVSQVTTTKRIGVSQVVTTCITQGALVGMHFGESAAGGTFEVTLDFTRR